MKISDAKSQFEERLTLLGRSVATIPTEDGIGAMIDFYRDFRSEECDLDADGDMLLFQWGVYNSSSSSLFEVNMTRQFIPIITDDDDELFQLSLTFGFAPDEMLRALGRGNKWCSSPSELPGFTSHVHDSPAVCTVSSRRVGSVSLKFFNAG